MLFKVGFISMSWHYW